MLCEMTVGNAEALGVLLDKYNVQLRRFPQEVYDAMLAAGADVAREAAEKDPFTRKVYESWLGFREKIIELSPLTELGYMALRDAQN
jgi:TRAP-type mannitol/chloroaromatic compound transport system substrate-binding protein